MSTAEIKRLMDVTDALAELLSASTDFHAAHPNHQQIASAFAESLARVRALKKRFHNDSLQQRFAFVGAANVGKSTLLNCLLGPGGTPITPHNKITHTTLPIEFSYGDTFTLDSDSPGQLNRTCEEFSSPAELHQRLATMLNATAANPRPTCIRATVPIQLLQQTATTFLDTPTLVPMPSSARAIDIPIQTLDYVGTTATHLFWVVFAPHSVSRRELLAFCELAQQIPYDIVVTGAETCSAVERQRYQSWLENAVAAQRIVEQAINTHFVSGDHALAGLQRNNLSAVESTGFMSFAQRIRSLARHNTSAQKYRQQLEEVARSLAQWLCDYRPQAPRTIRHPYEPSSLARWQAADQDCTLRRALTTHLHMALQPTT